VNVILDASAILALLNAEPGASEVAGAVSEAGISSVNLSEVVAKMVEGGMPAEATREALQVLGLEVISFDTQQAYDAGFLRDSTRSLGLSFGDRACLGLAQQLGLPVLTTDRNWSRLVSGIEVRQAR
jgi:PIN domain nuclease of toxin-antitoxin system